jgi:DNA-binding NarL/FixJ family response regulator
LTWSNGSDRGEVAVVLGGRSAAAAALTLRLQRRLLPLSRERIRFRPVQPQAALRQLRDCYASLTRREREVMALVVSGSLNKQVAFELGITERTVKEHRGKVMRKMKADSLPDLVRMAARLNVAPPDTTTEFM